MTDEEKEYETGPFCRHYGDPPDCDEPCKNCGHYCAKHDSGTYDAKSGKIEGGQCTEPAGDGICPCPGFMDKDRQEGTWASR